CLRLYLVLSGKTAGDFSARFPPATVGRRSFLRGGSSSAMGTRYCFHHGPAGFPDDGLLLGKFLLANCSLGRRFCFRYGSRTGAAPGPGAESHSTAAVRGTTDSHRTRLQRPWV